MPRHARITSFTSSMRVLICGHRSFAAKGLPQVLRAAGHDVTCFSRGPIAVEGDVVTGPVDAIHANPHLQRPFDAIVNYIMLKDEPIAPNLVFMDSLLRLCREQNVPHLVHISSISSYRSNVRVIHEGAALETDFLKKGSYGSIKAATEDHVTKSVPAGTKLSLFRPGFILGEGLLSPIVGTAVRFPANNLLVIGNAQSRIPVIARTQVHEAVARVLERPPQDRVEGFLIASGKSPTRLAFLDACCRRLGCGLRVKHFPVPLWYTVAIGAEVVARVLGQGKLMPWAKITARLPKQDFDPSRTEERLGLKFDTDWESLLTESFDGQERNFEPPYVPMKMPWVAARKLNVIGYGRIVKQRHVPALKRIGFTGETIAYDLAARTDDNGQTVRSIADAKIEDADLTIVATPGPAHASAIDLLQNTKGPILLEKPLCYSPAELERFKSFAAGRADPVYVCHNYRFKQNVERMLQTMRKYNPGRLRHVSLHFHSPPVGNDSVAWLRNERKARTLLMDYALHFLDLACMFGEGQWWIDSLRHELNSSQQTELIEGHLTRGKISVAFLLRQGFGPRRARVNYAFQNYSVSLGFFPDTFGLYMADENPWQHKREYAAALKATARKVFDRVTNRESDQSHALAIAGSFDARSGLMQALTVDRIAPFYDVLFRIADRVYEGRP